MSIHSILKYIEKRTNLVQRSKAGIQFSEPCCYSNFCLKYSFELLNKSLHLKYPSDCA